MPQGNGIGTLIVGAKAVKSAFGMKAAIGVVEEMLRRGATEIQSQPARSVLKVGQDSFILTMPAYSSNLGRCAVKIVTEFKKNPEKNNLPVQGGSILLIDCDNSRVLAMLDSPTVTEVRTGALTGLATRILSRPESCKVGVVGSGKEARTHLEAVCAVRRIKEARVASKNLSHAKQFAEEMSQKLEIGVDAVGTPREAARGADVVIAATSAATPVLSSVDISDGCHLNSIGTLPNRRELSSDLISRASVFVDTRAGVLKEAGDVMQAVKEGKFSDAMIKADLAELVLSKRPGRSSSSEVTLFKSVGFALADVYSASYIYDKILQNKQRWGDLGVVEMPSVS
ncbi:MAG TPA: ornithine cyclodeaminase family protein [Nitrososphaerales archaeon]|nr:ornithine cyclodeaminase family protein [Nitrososphaerales archaeon]